MRFALFYWILAVLVLWRFVWPLSVGRRIKWALSAIVLAVAVQSAVVSTCFGGLLAPEIPRPFFLWKAACEALLLALAAFVLLREVVIFFSVLAGRSGEKVHAAVQRDKRSAILMGVASAGLGLVGLNNAVSVPEVRRRTAYIPNLPAALEGFEFVQLSDIHCSALLTEPYAQALVERVNALRPKLVLITGDLVDGAVPLREKDIAPLAKLRAELGVWGCDGNHEHYGDYDAWQAVFKRLGISMLHNEHVVLNVPAAGGGTAPLVLAGVCDPHGPRFGREGPDSVKTFAGAPERSAAPRILLAHQPKMFPRYRANADFDLMLAGHTHGGQIIGMDEMIAVMNGGYSRGFYRTDPKKLPGRDALLYVHPGSGLWAGFAMRLGVPPEIALIKLSAHKPEATIF